MKFKKRYFLIIFLLTGVTMWLSNPSESKHKAAIKTAFERAFNNYEGNEQVKANIQKLMAEPVYKELLIPAIDQATEHKDYVVFSTTNLSVNQANTPIAIGVFGFVFVFPQFQTYLQDQLSVLK